MMIFPSMLLRAAKQAGMKIPELEDDDETFNADEFPHFHVFCNVQLARPIKLGEHWNNAKIIAAIPEDQVHTITLEDLIGLGLQFQS